MTPVGFEPKISAGERPQAAHLLRSWVRIPPGAWIFVCCECRVLSGRGLCDELITRPEEAYRLCCVVVCDLETSRMGAPYIYDISCLRVNFVSWILYFIYLLLLKLADLSNGITLVSFNTHYNALKWSFVYLNLNIAHIIGLCVYSFSY